MEHTAVRAASRFPWRLFFSIVVVAIFGSAGATFGVVQWLRRDLPSPEQVVAVQTPVKTTVYDVRGRVLHEFYRENRSPVPLRQIPRHLVNATLATEDRNFYQHWGVDLWGVGRAAVNNALHRRGMQGGSTITQQLARNLFLTHERTLTRKLKEAALAIELERDYSKDQILEMYFNQIYFGEGAYGVDAAARTFFDRPLQQLSLAQCALLAGIPANPSVYSPRRRPQAALARRGKVLRNMLETRAITPGRVRQRHGGPARRHPDALEQRPRPVLRRDGAAAPRRALRLERRVRGRPQGLDHARHGPAADRRARPRPPADGAGGDAEAARHARRLRPATGRRRRPGGRHARTCRAPSSPSTSAPARCAP